MLVHDRFVFIHHQKCGGTFVREVLKRELGREELRESVSHAGWERIPPAAKGRPVLCYVRNPWDWYVSWYESKRQNPAARGALFDRLSEEGKLDFAQTVRNACELSHQGAGGGLYTASLRHSAGGDLDAEILTVGRFESLIDDLDRFLAEAGVALPDGAIARARAAQPVNTTRRKAYPYYYDADLRDLVGESARPLIDRFGYAFEEPRSRSSSL